MSLPILGKIEDFFYKRIVKPLIFSSRLGRKSMFGYADSGINFDHIYSNEAKGYTKLGRIIDRILLNLPAAKATRYRKDKVISILKDEINKNIAKNKKTRIVDLASGPARYLVELITDDMKDRIEVLCLDIDKHSLDHGRKMAGNRPMLYRKSNILRIGSHHKRLSEKRGWSPNVVISSGLYEYLDDESVVSSLKTIKDYLEPGGLLLFITQRDSPNRKLIEKVGITKSGKEWKLFYRDPKLIEKWLVDLGYSDINTEIDPWGMYVFYKGRMGCCMTKKKLPDLVIGDLVINPPIIQGGMGVRVSTASLAAAVSNEGAVGVIASVGLGEEGPQDLTYEERSKLSFREMIKETKHLTSKPFGVNIMCALTNYDDLAKVAIEEEVGAIISGAGLPLHLPSLSRDSKTKFIPIVSSGRATELICKTWLRRYNRAPDALVLEGPLAGGHIGFKFGEIITEEAPSLEDLLLEVLNVVKKFESESGKKIPVIAAGGIFTGKDIAKMLKLGASGVQMATRFVCTNECDVSKEYKEAYLKCGKDDTIVVLSPVGMPARVIRNKFVERIESGEKIKFTCPYRCLRTCDPYAANYCIANALVNAYRGNLDDGFVMAGANADRIDKIVSVKDLINELVTDYNINA